jgi:Protein of unknown function (DUF3179)
VWETVLDGRQLHFHLAGINNQNFIMRDEETGSWWQQVSGQAIAGPLKGKQLRSVFCDEVSFGVWKREQPNGRVLKPDPSVAVKDYVPSDWDQRMTKVPVNIGDNLDRSMPPRTQIVGITIGNSDKAYPLELLVKQSPVIDDIGGVPIVIIVGKDRKSVRAYERVVDDRKLEFFGKNDAPEFVLVDAETGTEWDFAGKGITGQLQGKELKKVAILNDYWFDWKIYHPKTAVYDLGK